MGDFDKILKENIEALFLPLVKKLLGISIHNPVDLPEKLQSTIEREPDFLKKVTDDNGELFILHLEFQTRDEPKMVYRMAEYKALLQRKFELPVLQFVIYLGVDKPTMKTELPERQQIVGFQLRNIHDLPVNAVLESDVPEEIILSILTDYPKAEAEKVISRILNRLKSVAQDEASLKKNIDQLLMLSRLRKLDQETEKQIQDMPITYNIETDHLYNKGIEKGIERGVQQGEQQGLQKGILQGIQKGMLQGIELRNIEMVKKLVSTTSLTANQIAEITDTSITLVKKIKEENQL